MVSGDVPVLGRGWDGIKELTLTRAMPQGIDTTVALHPTDHGLEPQVALDKPGIYTAPQGDVKSALAVNPDPQGGDTRAIDPDRLGQWLSSVSSWEWLDTSDSHQSLAVKTTHTSLGWPLLCVVMGLAVTEMFLARWFSHAVVPGRGFVGQAIATLKGTGRGSSIH